MSHAGYHTEFDHQCEGLNCELKYPKQYHWHTWNDFRKIESVKTDTEGNKFYRDAQEYMCRKYNITLLYYRTPWQRRFDKLEHVENLIINGLKKFRAKQHERNQKRKARKNKTNKKSKKKNIGSSLWKEFTMSQRDYDGILGGKQNNLSGLTSSHKQKNMSGLTSSHKQKNMSGLTSSHKQKNMSGLTSSHKQKNMSGLTSSHKQKNMSGLISSNKQKDISRMFGSNKQSDISGLIGKKRKAPRF